MAFQLNDSKIISAHTKNSIRIGDNIKISLLGKERIQNIQGIVLAYHKASQTIKIRRVFQEVGFERIFSLYSPQIQSVKVLKQQLGNGGNVDFLGDRKLPTK